MPPLPPPSAPFLSSLLCPSRKSSLPLSFSFPVEREREVGSDMRSWREREFVGEREEEEEKGSKSRKSNDPAGFFFVPVLGSLSLSLQPQSFTHGLQPGEGRDKKASSSQRRRHRQRSPFPYPVRTLTEHGSKKTSLTAYHYTRLFFASPHAIIGLSSLPYLRR